MQMHLIEKSRDWMLRRLRRAKKEYNTLLKGTCEITYIRIHSDMLFYLFVYIIIFCREIEITRRSVLCELESR